MSIIFGKYRATGQRAEDPADAAAEIVANSVNLDEDIHFKNIAGFENYNPASRPSANNTQDQSNSSIPSQSSSRKSKANTEKALIGSLVESINNIGALCERTSKGIEDVASYFKSLSASNRCSLKIYEGLLAIEDLGLDELQMIEAGEIIGSDSFASKYFFTLPMNARKTFVWKKLVFL